MYKFDPTFNYGSGFDCKSEGHVQFIGNREYFMRGNELWSAPVSCVLEIQTRQRSGRFECYQRMAQVCINEALSFSR